MIPIHRLLARIRWDAGFGRAAFTIGYYDRVRRSIVRMPLARVGFAPGVRRAFETIEEDGSAHAVPLHRVREVYRDGELIWERRPRTALRRRSPRDV